MNDFYFGALEGTGDYGGRGGRGGKRSGTVASSKAKSGTASKAPAKTPFYKPLPTNKQPSAFRKGLADVVERGASVVQTVGKAVPYVQEGARIGSSVVNAVRGPKPSQQVVMAPSGEMIMLRRKKKTSKGLSGRDLKGYMKTVKLARMLVRTPKYMKKSIKAPRRSSSFR